MNTQNNLGGDCKVLLILVVAIWEGGGICTVNLCPVRDTGAPTFVQTDWTDGVPVENVVNIQKNMYTEYLKHQNN